MPSGNVTWNQSTISISLVMDRQKIQAKSIVPRNLPVPGQIGRLALYPAIVISLRPRARNRYNIWNWLNLGILHQTHNSLILKYSFISATSSPNSTAIYFLCETNTFHRKIFNSCQAAAWMPQYVRVLYCVFSVLYRIVFRFQSPKLNQVRRRESKRLRRISKS